MTRNFAITGVAGFVAPRHLNAIRDTGLKELGLVAHLGVMAPTANKHDAMATGLQGDTANLLGASTRWTDLFAAAPRGFIVRAAL